MAKGIESKSAEYTRGQRIPECQEINPGRMQNLQTLATQDEPRNAERTLFSLSECRPWCVVLQATAWTTVGSSDRLRGKAFLSVPGLR